MTLRWSRTLAGPESFSDDLGDLGTGAQDHLNVDRVLRHLLVAQRRAGMLRFPLKVHAQEGVPQFVLQDAAATRGLQVMDATAGRQAKLKSALPPASEGDASPRHTQDVPGAALCELVVVCPPGRLNEAAIDTSPSRPIESYSKVHLMDGCELRLDALGAKASRVDVHDDYDIDVCRWIGKQISALREQDWSRVDVQNLIEELDALARRDKRALKSRLRVLLIHLLKWHCQPSARSGSWLATIHENTGRLDNLLAESPSLRRLLDPEGDTVAAAYRRARKDAASESGLAVAEFPEHCPWSVALADAARGVRSLDAGFEDLHV